MMINLIRVLSKCTFNNQKKLMIYIVSSSLFLITGSGTASPNQKGATPSETQINNLAVDFYNTQGQWAGIFTIDHIEKTRIEKINNETINAHIRYFYNPIPGNRLGRNDTGYDQRVFYLVNNNSKWKVVNMGDYMSGNLNIQQADNSTMGDDRQVDAKSNTSISASSSYSKSEYQSNSAICAPNASYLAPQLRDEGNMKDARDKNWTSSEVNSKTVDDLIEYYERSVNHQKNILNDPKWLDLEQRESKTDVRDFHIDVIKVENEWLKIFQCIRNGGKFASSSADFDANGNYTGSSQQASNKKSKSGKGKNQEQVATADSNGNGTNSTESNNPESSDEKSKGKEFAKDEKRLHANACVSVIRKKNQLYGAHFKNICPYPIEVIWCANSKGDPNQCDRGWYSRSSFGVGHTEPINSIDTATHWVFAACKGENSIFTNDELHQKKQLRCVNWKN